MVCSLNSAIISKMLIPAILQATAHATGLVAYLLGLMGPSSIASVVSALPEVSVKGPDRNPSWDGK